MKYSYFIFVALFANITLLQAQITADKEGENGKRGFVDAKGNWVVPPKYYWTHWYEDDKYGTFNETSFDYEGAVDEWGKIIIPCQYSSIHQHRGYFYVEKELSKEVTIEGVCDKQGNVIIPCREYNDVSYNSSDNYFSVKKEVGGTTYEGVIDMQGKLIIPCEYTEVGRVLDAPQYYLHKGTKEGLADLQGNIIFPCIYDNLFPFQGIYMLENNGYQGVADLSGKIIIEPNRYKSITCWDSNKYYIVSDDSKGQKGILDEVGKELLPLTDIYDNVQYAGEDVFRVETKGEVGGKTISKYGYWGGGRELIAPQYDKVSDFQGGVATVTLNGQAKIIKNPLKDIGVQIASGTAVYTKEGKSGPAVSRYPAPNSDVDKNIPVASKKSETKFAFIIANENYAEAPVPYALNDGRIFREYCVKTLGLPENHVRMYEDATYGNIVAAVEEMKQLADAYEGDAELIFYYAGHGVPAEKENTAYLLPVDGSSSDVTATGYPLSKLYEQLSQMKLKDVTVFLDACFSGAKREDEMLVSARGVAIKTKAEAPRGNMVVFSAATGDETAHQLEEKGHGLFTYYLLKKLQQTQGNVTLGELSEYVTKQVKRQSVVINNKRQTPTTTPSESMTTIWTAMKL